MIECSFTENGLNFRVWESNFTGAYWMEINMNKDSRKYNLGFCVDDFKAKLKHPERIEDEKALSKEIFLHVLEDEKKLKDLIIRFVLSKERSN